MNSSNMKRDCPLVGQIPMFDIEVLCLVPHVAGCMKYADAFAVRVLGVRIKRRREHPIGTSRPMQMNTMLCKVSQLDSS
jgi:hypothetical protein